MPSFASVAPAIRATSPRTSFANAAFGGRLVAVEADEGVAAGRAAGVQLQPALLGQGIADHAVAQLARQRLPAVAQHQVAEVDPPVTDGVAATASWHQSRGLASAGHAPVQKQGATISRSDSASS